MAKNFLGKYHVWAGSESRKQLETLTDEEFSKNLGPILGSVRAKVEHIILAIESCFRRITDDPSSVENLVKHIKNMSKEELLKYWEHKDNEIANGLQGDTGKTIIIQRMDDSSFVMNLKDFYLQYVLHTVYHRGQLNYCLKKLNIERIEADYLYFFDELDIQER
ncbi:MAG: DinB family protein [Candidatus Hodarchaeota archaeon]